MVLILAFHLSYLGPLPLDRSLGADLSVDGGDTGGAALSYFCPLFS